MKKIFVVILNFNGKEDTLQCLRFLEKANVPKGFVLKILVIDNASVDDSVRLIRKSFPKVLVHESLVNTGFAKGNNIGIEIAMKKKADYVVLLNNDTEIDFNFFIELLKGVDRHPAGGVFIPKIYFAKGKEFHKDRYKKSDEGKVIWAAGGEIDWDNMFGVNIGMNDVDHGQFDEERQIELASGCCMLLTRKTLEELKGFDERYFMYYEDVDLCLRVRNAGFEIWYIPKSQIWHVSAGSSAIGSVLQDYFIARNRMLIGLKYAPWRTRLALVKESVKLLFGGREWQRKGIKDYFLRRFNRGSW